MSYQDRELTCRDCNREFVFTAGEQEFYASKGLQNDPVRCPECRNARKNARTTLENESGYIRYGGGASFGGRTPRQMHPAACALCGDMIEVPFIPRGDRPVFCSAVKRLMTQGFQLEEISRRWGIRPCQNDAVREVLRSGMPAPQAPAASTEAPAQN
ncbi:MAG: zinc-ribbon domain containing protein [Dehalococcoidia bacterium]